MSFQKYDSDRSIRWKRQSLRLPKNNYAWGAYFVTMCVKLDTSLFDMPELYAILVEVWEDLPQ